jgi:hypothetical protein
MVGAVTAVTCEISLRLPFGSVYNSTELEKLTTNGKIILPQVSPLLRAAPHSDRRLFRLYRPYRKSAPGTAKTTF